MPVYQMRRHLTGNRMRDGARAEAYARYRSMLAQVRWEMIGGRGHDEALQADFADAALPGSVLPGMRRASGGLSAGGDRGM